MFYYLLAQGWPLYQEIDTLFRRITWRQPVHCQLQAPVTDLGLTMHKHALLYKWLARRRQEWVSSLNKLSHSAPSFCLPVSPLSPGVTHVPWHISMG